MLYKTYEELTGEIEKKIEEFFEECNNYPDYLILWYGYSPLVQNSGAAVHTKEGDLELFNMKIIWTKKHMVEVY